jgi:gp16 family phage-associated protein
LIPQSTTDQPPTTTHKAMKTPLRTQAQARQWMDEQGLSQAELARQFGVSTSLVDAILRGSKPCKRGASHNIAVYLGLKRGQAVATRQPYRARAVQAAGAGAAA